MSIIKIFTRIGIESNTPKISVRLYSKRSPAIICETPTKDLNGSWSNKYQESLKSPKSFTGVAISFAEIPNCPRVNLPQP